MNQSSLRNIATAVARRSSISRNGRSYVTTTTRQMPMKPGTPLKELAVFKGQDPPVTLDRSEYPDWVNDLAKPQPSLAALRKIPNEEAELHEIKRYLKLTRRQAVRQRNEESAN